MSFFKKNDDGFVEILKEVQETIQGEVLDEETETCDFEKARAYVIASVGLYLALVNDFGDPTHSEGEVIDTINVIAHSIPIENGHYRTQTDIIKVPKYGQSYIDHPTIDLFS